jgi:uncharacterized protein YyaL (SSP411 family)
MANLLGSETSPYLLQHRDNPVDWRPWGAGAREAAAARDVPILLSIGYSACHWCHVMEHESFTDAETAAYMNEHFVPVKVDREERPDVDAIYMEAVQGMTGHGGWPLTAFVDPDGVPFYGGTYFPPEPRQGMPSFRMVMEAVVDAWSNRREEIAGAAARTVANLGAVGRLAAPEEEPGAEVLEEALATMLTQIDRQNGGFGSAPKFPPAAAVDLLLARGEHELAELTLDRMAAGGIYDQLGGGFARYSVDAVWLVPHFEKMLYDNALLARSYVRGWQRLGHDRWRRVATETLDWALREMQGPEGGFHSALDADSEGVEGRFYVWTEAEARAVLAKAGLGADADGVLGHLGVSPGGNFEGANVLHLPAGAGADPPPRFDEARAALLAAREQRIRPDPDDKRLASWNALMVSALAEAGAAFGEDRYLEAADRCAGFLLGEMCDAEGRLLRTYKDGEARLNAYLEDHAYLFEALLTLFEATLEERWYGGARRLADTMIARFADTDNAGFFTTSHDHERLVARRKDIDDHPIPSGNASAALGLLRLAALSGESSYERLAVGVLRMLAPAAQRQPYALAYLLTALDFHLAPTREIALIAPAGRGTAALAELAAVVRDDYRPHAVLAGGEEGADSPELLRDRPAVGGAPSAYVCERFACKAPVTAPGELEALLG